MNLYELAKVATYLNLATIKIKENAGSIQWLTDTATTIAFEDTAQSQETQCLSFGSTLWIANNDDRDTTTQKTFVDTLGIKNGQKLVQHSVTYGRRPLEFHQDVLTPNALTMKQTFLYSLVGGGQNTRGNAFVLPAAVANGTFNITNEDTAPAIGAIVFVRGAYEGDAAVAMHAEQKLLAALALSLRNGGTKPSGEVAVGGVKSACGTCMAVLKAARRRVNELKLGITLQFENARANELREAAGLGADNNAGIKALDIDHYFAAVP